MSHPGGRPRYRPDGGVDLAQVPISFLLLLSAGLGVALALYVALASGFYLWPYAVAFAGWGASAAARAAVVVAHCRDRALAGALGAALGLAGYLSYFHLDHCLRWGGHWAAVGDLPDYVAFRMETDHWQWFQHGGVVQPRPPAQGERPLRPLAAADFRTFNWAFSLFEAVMLPLVTLTTAVSAAAAPYSTKRGRWCDRETLHLEPTVGETLRESLASGTVPEWVAGGPRKVSPDAKHVRLDVWYAPPAAGEPPGAEVYVGVGGDPVVELSPREVAALTGLLPGLRNLTGPALELLAADAVRSGDPTSGRVWKVPAEYAGRVRNSETQPPGWRVSWAALWLPGVAIMAGLMGLAQLGGRLFANGIIPEWGPPALVFAGGVACLVFIRYWYDPDRWQASTTGRGFRNSFVRRAVAERPETLVLPDDPRAVYAEMVPRMLWERGHSEPGETNEGLLLVDEGGRELLFEGDYECYRIPAAAVLSVDVEPWPGQSVTTSSMWVVVLRVRLGAGTWEFPFAPLANIEGRNNWEKAAALVARVEAIRAG